AATLLLRQNRLLKSSLESQFESYANLLSTEPSNNVKWVFLPLLLVGSPSQKPSTAKRPDSLVDQGCQRERISHPVDKAESRDDLHQSISNCSL
ncbi:MAG: hypothetical protein MRY59_02330, partial [Aquisalinus sp.]|nr:hypothetical protein [Aquisalinus sp.]